MMNYGNSARNDIQVASISILDVLLFLCSEQYDHCVPVPTTLRLQLSYLLNVKNLCIVRIYVYVCIYIYA